LLNHFINNLNNKQRFGFIINFVFSNLLFKKKTFSISSHKIGSLEEIPCGHFDSLAHQHNPSPDISLNKKKETANFSSDTGIHEVQAYDVEKIATMYKNM
jgi:hypothetical protein